MDSEARAKLETFDRMDLDDPQEGRLAAYSLYDYFGYVFTSFSDELELRPSDTGQGIEHQWNKIHSRIKRVDGISIPEKYDNLIRSTDSIRNDVVHDFLKEAPPGRLERNRELASDWYDWLEDSAGKYQHHQEQLTGAEALIELGQNRLDYVMDFSADYSEYDLELGKMVIEDEAEELQERLDEASGGRVSKSLVNLVADILNLEDNKKSLESDYFQAKWENQQDEIIEAEHTVVCEVTENNEKFDRITIVTKQAGHPDTSFTLGIKHPETPNDAREQLKELDVGDEALLQIETDVVDTETGGQVMEHYVADIDQVTKS